MRTETRPFVILLAEDNSADVGLVRRALDDHKVDCVLHVIHDGEQVINWLGSLDSDPELPPLDLLLLDMHLPKRNGLDILRYLRSTENYAQTPVVVMTVLDSSLAEEEVARNAALFYFSKPSSLDEFMKLGSIVQDVLVSNKKRSAEHRAGKTA